MLDSQKQKAKALVSAFNLGDNRAQSTASGVDLVVTLTVAALVAAFLIPVAINELVGVDTSSWGSGASSLWEIMDLVVVLAIFLFMIGLALSRGRI